MKWTQCPNEKHSRCLSVAFEDEDDVALLNPKHADSQCIFEGTFVNAPSTRIFATSKTCLDTEDAILEISFADERSETNMFEVNAKSGMTKLLSPRIGEEMRKKKVTRKSPEGKTTDRMAFDKHQKFSKNIEEKGTMYPNYPPTGFVITLVVFYDDAFLQKYRTHQDSVQQVEKIIGHAQTYFSHQSLEAEITFDIAAIEHYPNTTTSTDEELLYLSENIVVNDVRSPNSFIFIGVDDWSDPTIGLGWFGIACYSEMNKQYRTEILEDLEDDLVMSALTFANMIGFTLGIDLDFYQASCDNYDWQTFPKHCRSTKDECTYTGSIMGLWSEEEGVIDNWSCCSNDDFALFYEDMTALNGYFCLSPNFAKLVECDPDVNCHGNGVCTELGSCQCHDGFEGSDCSMTTVVPTKEPEDECKDKKSSKWCKENKKKCNKANVYENCRKTCNKCDDQTMEKCKDKMKKTCKKIKKMKKKKAKKECKKKINKKRCKKTCNKC